MYCENVNKTIGFRCTYLFTGHDWHVNILVGWAVDSNVGSHDGWMVRLAVGICVESPGDGYCMYHLITIIS